MTNCTLAVLKVLTAFLAEPLAGSFYISLTTAVVRDDGKTAVISHKFKNKDPEDFANYRPVRLTSVVCKVFDRV